LASSTSYKRRDCSGVNWKFTNYGLFDLLERLAKKQFRRRGGGEF